VLQSKVIAIGRNVPAADVPRIGEALVAGGVHVIELTLNEPEAHARMGGWLIGDGDPAGVTQRARQVAEAVSGASGRAGA
jgi:2-keto-3-deoxy-6-phosphogluconate aldolase